MKNQSELLAADTRFEGWAIALTAFENNGLRPFTSQEARRLERDQNFMEMIAKIGHAIRFMRASRN